MRVVFRAVIDRFIWHETSQIIFSFWIRHYQSSCKGREGGAKIMGL